MITVTAATTISQFIADQFAAGVDIEDYVLLVPTTYEAWGVDDDGDDVRYIVTVTAE